MWTGEMIMLGDGEPGYSYPFTSLDAICHEYGHVISEGFSRLLNMGQTGGVSDAFSDAFAMVRE